MKTSGRASEDEQGSVNFAIHETEKQEHDPVFSGQEDDGTVSFQKAVKAGDT